MLTYWTCTCGSLSARGVKRCPRCGAAPPVHMPVTTPPEHMTVRPAERKADPPARVPERQWPEVDQRGMRIARRFGVERTEGES